MQEVKNVVLEQSQILHPSGMNACQFLLKPKLTLVVFFHRDWQKSIAVCIQPELKPAKDWVNWMVSSFGSLGANEFDVKIISSTHDPSAIVQQLESLKFKISGRVIRDRQCEGELDFAQKRLRVEKAAQQEVKTENKKVRVLIVDDSKTIRDLLTKVFSSDHGIEVVGTAEDPYQVEQLIPKLKPDVITLDIHMPGMDGVTLLKQYLPKYKIPTVMISSVSIEDGPYVLNALEFGAVDYIQKPTFGELSTMTQVMIEKIKAAANAKVKIQTGSASVAMAFNGEINPNILIVLGSSTGGTEALKQVFCSLPSNIPPILVVQHIPAVFSKAFAMRLNQLCSFEVKEAADGDEVKPNQVLIAPGGFQMSVVEGNPFPRIKIKDDSPVNRHKPSVDYLFDSVASVCKRHEIIAGILTGMGADGAKGMKKLKDLGARTLAQDEATSVVYGMPREAARLGCVDSVLPLNQIGAKLVEWSTDQRKKKFA